MRLALRLFAVSSVILFILYVAQLSLQLYEKGEAVIQVDNTLSGFQNSTEIPGLKELKELYVAKIKASNGTAERSYTYWLWLSFLVTALTAAATLVSSIKAAKNDDSSAKKSLIIIAMLTFFASLGNWGTTQFNESRSTALKKSSALSEHRTNFYLEFQKAADDTQKADVVRRNMDALETM